MTEPTPNDSQETPETVPVSPAPDRHTLLTSIAEQLVKAREASGQDVEDVMRELKLRRVYLEALESGNWDNMPGQVYALGFLRQYAAHLHLDLEDEITQLKDGKYRLTKPLTYPDPPIAPSRKWAISIGIAFVVLFILFNISSHDETREAVPPMEPPTAEPLPAPTTMEAPGGSEAAAQPMQPPVTETETPAAEATAPAANDSAVMAHRVDLEAVNSEAWIEVYLPDANGEASGEPFRQKLLQPGEHMLIDTTSPSLLITCGNAASLQVSVDGELRAAAGSLGKPGKVIHNYRVGFEETVPTQNDLSD